MNSPPDAAEPPATEPGESGTCRVEAVLPPGAAATFLRRRAIAAHRTGPARSAPVAVTWLDTAGGALAAEGLALEQGRDGQRRLLRVIPERDAPWQPGTLPDVVAALAPGEAPADAADAALSPLAHFSGRCTRLNLGDGIEATFLRGELKAGTAAAPAARLILSGAAPAILRTMRALAAELPLLPPRAALAEEARALAQAETCRPRRHGAPRPDADAGVEEALVFALGHLAEVLAWHLPAARAGTTPAGVHQLRVAIRRLRSLLRVFRPACDDTALRDFDAALKALAQALGPAREWDVWLEGLGAEVAAALPDDPRIAALLAAAREARQAAYAALRPVLDGPAPRTILWDATMLAQSRPWRAEPDTGAAAARAEKLAIFAACALDRRWRRIIGAGPGPAIAALPDDAFHALRIQAKRLRYAAELFAPLWGRKRPKRFLSRLADVQDAFGLAHDATIVSALMTELAGRDDPALQWAGGVAEGWALARARRARARAAAAWDRLSEAPTFWD